MKDEFVRVAEQAALEGGAILRRYFGQVRAEEVRQKSANDFLSFVDEQAEQKIIQIISHHFPDHAFLAEEQGASGRSSAYRWIIDPLDGTKNYLSGIPVFAISIALQIEDKLTVGVIYDPMREEMFTARSGKGAYLNGKTIRVSDKKHLSESLLATGFPFKAKHFLTAYQGAFRDLFLACQGMRRMGAAAIDMAYCAAGRFDGFWELGLSPWDVAAGTMLITEAGGKVTDFWNGERFLYDHYLAASNGLIHQELISILQKHFPSFKAVYSDKRDGR